jgi:hypothetical protein
VVGLAATSCLKYWSKDYRLMVGGLSRETAFESGVVFAYPGCASSTMDREPLRDRRLANALSRAKPGIGEGPSIGDEDGNWVATQAGSTSSSACITSSLEG